MSEAEDRISSLFDTLLLEILSLLPIKSAAVTSALSRRWQYLWTQITTLRFTSDEPLPAVDHILPQLTSPVIRTLFIPQGGSTSSITSCFNHIRCFDDVEEIEVCCSEDSEIILPPWVFQCQSLVTLVLWGELRCKLPDSFNLPNLKKLIICLDFSARNLIEKTLFTSCPSLEFLDVHFSLLSEASKDDQYFVDIAAPNLKYLEITVYDLGPLPSKIVINTPKLLGLFIHDDISSTRYSFVSIPLLLDKVCLCIAPEPEDDDVMRASDTLVSDIVNAISNVRSLELRYCIEMVNYLGCMDDKTIPIFRNLTLLEVNFDCAPGSWKDLLLSLRCFPNLEKLKVSRWPQQEEDWGGLESLPTHLLSKLKIIKIKRLPLYDSDKDLIGYILSKANSLERLSIQVTVRAQLEEVRLWKEYGFFKTLFKLPKSSSTCVIELRGVHIHASSSTFEDGFNVCMR